MESQKKEKKKVGRSVASKVEIALLVLVVFLLGVVLYNRFVVNDGDVKLFGYSQAVVISGSMIPAIDINDIVVYKDIPYEEYKVKDVVIYLRGEKRICHRIIDIEGDQVITQGDANVIPDDPVNKEQLQGKIVLTIPKIGVVTRWLLTPTGVVCMIVVLLLICKFPAIVRILKKN